MLGFWLLAVLVENPHYVFIFNCLATAALQLNSAVFCVNGTFILSFILAPFACHILILFRDEPGEIPVLKRNQRRCERGRHSHILGSGRDWPLAMTGGEIEFGVWWAVLFLQNAFADCQTLTGINR